MLLLLFSGSAFLATLFLSADALPHSQPPKGLSLALSLEVPSSVDDVGDFTITGTLKSDDPRDIKVVTDPSGILSDYFTADVLDFRKELDETEEEWNEKTMPTFMGDRVKWSIETYLIDYNSGGTDSDNGGKDTQSWALDESSSESSDYASDDDAHSSQVSDSDSSKSSTGSSGVGGKIYPPHTTRDLKAGEPMHFEYKVGKGYDFRKSGAGVYDVKLSRDFFWVLIHDDLTKVKVDVKSSKVTINGKLAGKFPSRKKIQARNGDVDDSEESSLGTINCPAAAIPIILRSVKIAMKLVAASLKSLEDMHAHSSRRGPYEYWFGDWDTKKTRRRPYRPRDHVKAVYKGLRPFDTAGDRGGYTYDCACDRNIMAYMNMEEFYDAPENPLIHLCQGFRSQTTPYAGGTNTKAGVLIHEATHFPFVHPPTSDIAYDPVDAHALRLKPFDAVINADSYEYFSEGLYDPSMDESN